MVMTTDASQQKVDVAKAGLTPVRLIQTYSSEDWEDFILEWTEGFETAYQHVTKLAGAGDKGRDVVGYLGDPQANCEWDSYQCKHYDHPIIPTEVYVEVGKLCVYTHRGDFTVPRRYRFVAPRGVGVKLHDMLRHPEKLRQELIDNWAKYCEKEISKSQDFPLTGALADYVNKFEFTRLWYLTPQEILNQHQKTKHWKRRFPGEPLIRPACPPPPADPQGHELVYLKKLLGAYSDHVNQSLTCIDDLKALPKLETHLRRSRGYFYTAEALARFSRDNLNPGAFEDVRQHVFDGVADATMDDHADGFQCVLAVTEAAAIESQESNARSGSRGVCYPE
jgi:hypothetical protein